ncbi:hypothetical protein ACUQO8_002185 [Klebsiella pneumoniae]
MNNDGLTLNQLAERNAALVTELVKLRTERDQLAAENVGLKKFIQTDCVVAHIEPETFYEEEVTRYVSADGYEPETPATDRIVAGIKADGATAAGDYLKLNAQHMPVVERLMMQDAAEICYGTAARLREGAK